MRRFFVGLVAIAGLGLGTPAAAKVTFEGARVIDAIDAPTLQTVLAEVGATTAPLDDEENTQRVGFPNGMRGVARRMACIDDRIEGDVEEGACKGLILLGYFSRPDDVSPEQAQDAIRQFGLEQNLASVVINDQGEHVVKAYVIFDGGITMANLAVRVALFGESIAAYQRVLYRVEG
ncbi:MAG: hypothetical protein WBA51_18040 [Erythrobacter sp.]